MRAAFRRFLAILDGTPTGTRGQSLVELTLTLPVLLIMLLGLTEIGWYANNYLTLLDVVREAGRFGATRDPMIWVDGEEKNYHRMDCEELSDKFDKKPFENNTNWPGPDLSGYGYGIRGERLIGYYDGVACSVIGNMAPLEFDDLKDDIAVSVFQYHVIDPGTPDAYIKIVGRLPARTNECQGDDLFDPFDWKGSVDVNGHVMGNGSGSDQDEDAGRYDAEWDNVRGYVFRGNHLSKSGGGTCLGSEFSTADIEEMLDFKDNPDRIRKMEQATDFGLVLVEIFWTHKQLLGLPWMNLGPIEEGSLIHVWTFFPVSAAEPDLG
jgi:hypothetical protein